ncbi:hypothetical protein PWEIH_01912 [Listeria weihenstephanensis FSL R9-0317]|uniref:Gram-positive cocci surface proteins LPxTG domain-containing protein n=1 Tax=Listeria weihenstephanensis TaxID=1006155 RepID=A0A1S7FQP9_9LIST|nr:Ig-like domain-containing protein [Listeria weihenstephanensis]AQY49733.1 hypothetical protein UE46_00740 [Listeria weihenstephanensis]EUJ41024.1 hypothetical protein PWEIH_01912 [Listeria weihenstephanensis FSL R9-0317]
MNKNMKKLVVSMVAFNVVASTMITAMPGMGMAAENQGSAAEQKLLGAGLTASKSLTESTEISNLLTWTPSIFISPYTNINLGLQYAAPDANGWNTALSDYGNDILSVKSNGDGSYDSRIKPKLVGGKYNVAGSYKKLITTIPGHKYKFTYKATNIAISQMSVAVRNGSTYESTLISPAGNLWNVITGSLETVEFTATSTQSSIWMNVISTSYTATGTIRLADLSLNDTDAIQDTTLTPLNTNSTTATGTGEPGGTVVIKNGGTEIGRGTVDGSGNYSVIIPKQAAGTVVEATVSAKSMTSSATQTVTQGAIVKPTINTVNDKATSASGTGEPNSTLTLSTATGNYTTMVDGYGNWSVTIPKQVAGTNVDATSVKNGITSPKASTVVLDVTAPDAPTISAMDSQASTIKGLAEANSTVKLYANDVYIGAVTANASGNYSLEAGPYTAGTKISATATDAAGNVSGKTDITVTAATIKIPTINTITDQSTTASGTGEPNSSLTLVTATGNYTTMVDGAGNWSMSIPKQVAGTNVDATSVKNSVVSPKASTTVVDVTAPDAPVINAMNSQATTIKGTAEANSKVKLYANDVYLGEVTTNASGNYSLAAGPYTAGTKISATATDAAGNVSVKTDITVTAATIKTPVINTITDQSITASGTGEPNSTLSLKIDNLIYTATVDGNGNWSTNIAKPKAGIIAEATSVKDGITSAKATTTVLDITAPDAPKIDAMTDKATAIKGTAEANATVQLYANNTLIGNTKADQNGNYTLAAGPYAAGTKISATATDAAGNTSSKTEITVTAAAIATPTINTITDKSTTASGTAEPNSALSLKIAGITYAVPVDSNGNWSTVIPKPMAGTAVEATSVLNDITSAKAATTVIDVTAPDAPILQTVTDKDTHIKGTGEANTTVTITLPNNSKISGIVDGNGRFDIIIPKQVKDTTISATLTDAAGNVSATGSTIVVHQGPSAPTLNDVTDKSTSVNGTGEPGDTITIKITDNGSSISYTGKVDDFGDYSIPVDKPNAGAKVEAIAKDDSGALSPKASTIVKDVTAPDAPQVQGIQDTDTKVKGKGEPNCDVNVKLPSGGIVNGRTDSDGNFEVTIPKQQAGKVIQVTLTDDAGNESKPTSITVQTSVIANPTIDRVTNQDTKATGTGIAGATVTVKANGVSYTGVVDTSGKYSIAIPKQAAGTLVTAEQAKDGKTSGSVNTTVVDDHTPSKPNVNPVKDSDTAVTGDGGTKGDTIKVTTPDGKTYTGVVGDDGKWSVVIPEQAAGTKLDVIAEAPAPNGKTSTPETVTVLDNHTPAKPNVNPVKTTDAVVTGDNGTKGDTIKVTTPDGKTYTGIVGDDGKWSVAIPPQAADAKLDVIAIAPAPNGKTSTPASVIVQDDRTPATPNVNPIKDSDTKVTGDGATKGDTIKVTTPDGKTYTGIVGDDGKWSIPVPAQAAGAKIDVIAIAPSGKTSPTKQVTVVTTPQSGTITANDFTIGQDKYFVGNFTGDVKSFRVTIGSNVYTGGSIDAAKGTYTFYGLDKATAVGTFKVEGLDKYGNVLDTKTAKIVNKSSDNTPGTGSVTANGYVINKDKQVTGKLTGDVKSIKLVYDGVTYSGGTINADGTFSFYALNTILDKTKSARIDGYDAKGNKIATSAISLTNANDAGSGVGSGTIKTDSFALGTDKNITGTFTGDVKSIKVSVDGVVYSGGTLNPDGTFSFYAVDKIATVGQVVFVDGYDKNGNKIATSVVNVAKNVPVTVGTITPNTFTIPTDKYLTASYTGDVKSVAVFINGVKNSGGTVANNQVNFYIGNKISSTSDVVAIEAYDASGNILQRKNVTINGPQVATGEVTPAPYTIGNSTLTGTYTGDIKTVQVKINNDTYSGGTVSGGAISFYVGNKITATTDVVTLYGYDSKGVLVDTKTVSVSKPAVGTGTVTPAPFTVPGDKYLTGTYTGTVKSVIVTINGVEYSGGTLENNTLNFYIGDKITSATDVVTVKALDANKNIIDTKTVTLVAAKPEVGTIVPASFSLKTSSITGTYTGEGRTLRVTVNGTALAVGGTVSGGNLSYYVGIRNKITATTDVVKIALLDKNGLVMEEKTVTIVE